MKVKYTLTRRKATIDADIVAVNGGIIFLPCCDKDFS
jgi:hypothetical protein